MMHTQASVRNVQSSLKPDRGRMQTEQSALSAQSRSTANQKANPAPGVLGLWTRVLLDHKVPSWSKVMFDQPSFVMVWVRIEAMKLGKWGRSHVFST